MAKKKSKPKMLNNNRDPYVISRSMIDKMLERSEKPKKKPAKEK